MAVSVISIFLFLSTPSARRATLLGQPSRNLCIFLSTPSARRATTTAAVRMPSNMDFYPRPPRGGRQISVALTPAPERFLSTPSARRATAVAVSVISIFLFLSTPSARRATLLGQPSRNLCIFLSTPSARRATSWSLMPSSESFNFYPRPPRGGRLARLWLMQPSWTNFYPRPPRGGRRGKYKDMIAARIFLSTPSARRATVTSSKCRRAVSYFYPRPPRGGRPGTFTRTATAGSDFYPRPPRGGRREQNFLRVRPLDISIHALREEGDAEAFNYMAMAG